MLILPFVWRGWADFGCGALGDMGSYSFDTIFRVLKLEAPVERRGQFHRSLRRDLPAGFDHSLRFPSARRYAPVKFTWYDGGLKPPRPEELEENRPFKGDGRRR